MNMLNYTDKLNKGDWKLFDSWLRQLCKNKYYFTKTNWEAAVEIWNNANSRYPISQEDIDKGQPDYTTILPYKKDE